VHFWHALEQRIREKHDHVAVRVRTIKSQQGAAWSVMRVVLKNFIQPRRFFTDLRGVRRVDYSNCSTRTDRASVPLVDTQTACVHQ
jgi:hypothetical protein